MDTKPKSKRGFARMTLERRRQISAMGGKATPKESRYFSANPEAARENGRKGGMAKRARYKTPESEK